MSGSDRNVAVPGMIRIIDSGLNRLAAVMVGVMLSFAAAAVFLQILVRFVLPPLGIVISAPWTEEIARFLITWSVFLGAAVQCRRGGLIAVTSLPAALPPNMGRALLISSATLTAVFFGFLLFIGWDWAIASAAERATVLRIPMTVVYASMPVGSVLAVLNLGLFLAELIRADRSDVTQILSPAATE